MGGFPQGPFFEAPGPGSCGGAVVREQEEDEAAFVFIDSLVVVCLLPLTSLSSLQGPAPGDLDDQSLICVRGEEQQ